MATSAIPAPGPRAPSRLRWTSTDLRAGRGPVAGLALALALLLVLLGTAWVNAARLSHDRHDHPALLLAGQEAIAGGIDTAATLRSTAALRRSPGLSAVRAVLPRSAAGSALGRTRSLTAAVRAEGESRLDVRRADAAAATRTARGSLVVAGLLVVLLAAGAATGISRSTAGPPDRVGAVLQAPAGSRPDRRRRPTTEEAGDAAAEADGPDTGPDDGPDDGLERVITGIAQQTELLALDAAIDAARAREAGVGGSPGDVTPGACITAPGTRTAATTGVVTLVRAPAFAAARSRAHGPTTALWHAVEVHRPFGEVDGPCGIAVCGSLVRLVSEQRWPVAERAVCPACATLAR